MSPGHWSCSPQRPWVPTIPFHPTKSPPCSYEAPKPLLPIPLHPPTSCPPLSLYFHGGREGASGKGYNSSTSLPRSPSESEASPAGPRSSDALPTRGSSPAAALSESPVLSQSPGPLGSPGSLGDPAPPTPLSQPSSSSRPGARMTLRCPPQTEIHTFLSPLSTRPSHKTPPTLLTRVGACAHRTWGKSPGRGLVPAKPHLLHSLP